MKETLHTCPTCQTSGFTASGLRSHKCRGINRNQKDTGGTSVPPRDPYAPTPRTTVLLEAKTALEKNRAILTGQINEFEKQTLPYKLCLGLHCMKAYMVFVLPDPKVRGAMKGTKKLVTRDGLSELEGYEGWLSREAPWLKKPVSYKYMTALRGLGLAETNTEEDIFEAVAQNQRIGPCTLKMLTDAAAEAVRPQLKDSGPVQTEFEFLKDNLHEFATQALNILSIADQLKAIPQMHKAACARVYGLLRDLTGHDWQPSDTPDSLCEIDPDTIDL